MTATKTLRRIEILDTFRRVKGFMYTVPVLQSGDTADDPSGSKLIVFENEVRLRQGHEHHSTIEHIGRGSYSHWEGHLLFSTSDNSDPNTNGRTYSYAIDRDHASDAQPSNVRFLRPPFIHNQGFSWTVAIPDSGDDVTNRDASTLRLLEDDRPIGPGHAPHSDIVERGAGAFSHWQTYLYFSTSDGSDPNTNGRLYSYTLAD